MEPETLSGDTPGLAPPLVDYELLPISTADQRSIRAAHRVYEALIQLWAPGVIEAAFDLNVFRSLADEPACADALAQRLGTDRQATRVLLEALCVYSVIGCRDVQGGGREYYVPDEMLACLIPGQLHSLAGKVIYDRQLAWSSWRDLAARVRRGAKGQHGEPQANQISAEHYASLVGGINFWAPPIVEILIGALADLGWTSDRSGAMLDVGCGTGLYSQLVLRRYPRLTAVGLDVADILQLAKEQARQFAVGDRFRGVACDFTVSDWGTDVDLILIANIMHIQTSDSARNLVLRAAKALAPGGILAIVDQIVDGRPHSSQDRFAMLFAVSMLATGGGDTYRTEEYERWFSDAGLSRIALLDAPMHRVLLAGAALA
jgi:SAM-dependent methyltransferase